MADWCYNFNQPCPGKACFELESDGCLIEERQDQQELHEQELYDTCGRWSDGGLSRQCRLSGTEHCDWDCPIGIRQPKPLKDLPLFPTPKDS